MIYSSTPRFQVSSTRDSRCLVSYQSISATYLKPSAARRAFTALPVLHVVMQTSGYRVENSNTLDLRDLHVAERSHQNHNSGLPSAPASSSNGLYMTSKFLPGPSQLFPTDNIAGPIDTHPSAEHSYYTRSSSYGHPSHTNSADFGSRFGSHHQQFLPHSETLTPSTSQAFHTNPLPETSWASSGIAANSAGQANSTSNELRYPANHKNTQSSGFPVPAFTPPLTGREGFRSFGSSAHHGDNPSLYLSTAADDLEQSGPPSVPFDHYGRLQAPHPFPSPNHLPLNSTYRSTSTSATNDYPSSVVESARSFHLSAEAPRAPGPSGVQLGHGSKADEPLQSLESSHPEMNPFPEYGEESRKRMRYMDETIAQGGHSKDYPGDKGPHSNKRERKGRSYLCVCGYRWNNAVFRVRAESINIHSERLQHVKRTPHYIRAPRIGHFQLLSDTSKQCPDANTVQCWKSIPAPSKPTIIFAE